MGRSSLAKSPLLVVLAAITLVGCAGVGARTAPAAAPGPDDCVEIKVWSNGYHTSLALPGAAFGPEHPIRQVFPDQTHFLIGYGEEEFFQTDDPGVGAALRAAAAPTPGVLHVIAAYEPVENRLWRPSELAMVAVSHEGLAAIAAGVSDTLELVPSADGSGAPAPLVVGEGRVPGASAFLASTLDFHLFHMCNHWTAERLAAAGVPVTPRYARADALMDALRREAPAACPAPAGDGG